MLSQSSRLPVGAKFMRLDQSVLLGIALLGVLGLGAANARAQASTTGSSGVSRTAKAVTYRRGGVAKASLRGTNLMPGGSGEAQVENKGNRVEIEVTFEGMEAASKFGFEYLTYVLWAVSPQGRPVNLGEVQVKNGAAQVKAITDMQTFGMVVTAEPYFAVSQPGDEVVLENAGDAGGENIGATYELVPHGVYSSSNTKIENVIFGIDRKTPIELFEARNAVRIAKNANAGKYAASTISKADQQLKEAEDAYGRKSDKKTVISMARDAVQTAEEARVISVKQKAEEDAQAQADADKRAAEERTAKARADAEEQANRRQEAEQARLQAEQAKAEAERMKEDAMKAAADAARAKQDADRARQAAVADQQAALAQKQAAEAETEKARQAAAKAEAEKADMRAQLLAQLNSILQTNDSARGLIVNMSDVLFDTGSFTLKPGAREKLAKVSGILLAHPGLNMQIEGHTDSVGGEAYNVRLSEQRAESVRDFLGEQGVTLSSITAQGFGKAEPVATNDTPEGRQRNRRVEIVVNGDAIGTSTSATARPANQNAAPESSTNLPRESESQPEK
ncbi:MAG TPA: OmpA family protein [Candidatus Acidoferrum sp.]|jgi:outer membrane protein OmpA-like peptidoglycan-associated protein|nr:OmpA family protein [Candidatus Acidoferrum sp.]